MRGTIMKICIDRVVTTTVVTTPPTLEKLQAALDGGSIEVVPYFMSIFHEGRRIPCVAFCDTDGKGKGLPYNRLANDLWDLALKERNISRVDAAGNEADYLVGPVIVVFGDTAWMEEL